VTIEKEDIYAVETDTRTNTLSSQTKFKAAFLFRHLYEFYEYSCIY